MKLSLILCFLFMANWIFPQKAGEKVDTVFCTNTNTSYLIFKDKVDLVDIGSPEDYASQIEDNSVFIKALKPGPGPSTMLIKMGKSFYYGVVKYKAGNKTFFYDFNSLLKSSSTEASRVEAGSGEKENSKTSKQESGQTKKLNPQDSVIQSSVLQVVTEKNSLSTLGCISEFLEAAVTVIRNDNKNTYLKIVLKNKSSIPYKLDFISFQYFQHMNKGILKKAKQSGMDVFPVATPSLKEIAPLSTKALGYAVASFGLAEGGYLMILFRESSGDRVLKIKVSGSEIQSAQTIGGGK